MLARKPALGPIVSDAVSLGIHPLHHLRDRLRLPLHLSPFSHPFHLSVPKHYYGRQSVEILETMHNFFMS